jgi:cell division protein FtsL
MPKALPREWYGEGIRNASVQREKVHLDLRSLAAWVAASAVLLCCLLLYVSQGIQVIRCGYELDRLQDRFTVLKAERQRLEVELASLQNLQVVEREAVERLGMVFPRAGQVIVVRSAAPGQPVAAAPSAAARAVAAAR